MTGHLARHLLRHERRARQRARAARRVLFVLAFGGPLVVALVIHARLTDPVVADAVRRWIAGWTILVLLGCAVYVVSRWLADRALGSVARDLDQRTGNTGLFATVVYLIDGEAEGALAPLVLARADAAAAGAPALAVRRHPRWPLKRTAWFVLLSLILAILPGGARGTVSGIGGGSEDPSHPSTLGPRRPESRPTERPESKPESRPELDELAQLTLVSDHQIYGLENEITLTLGLVMRHPLPTAVPMEVVLAVTDGLPSPDVGFGEGYRVVPLRLDWSLPTTEGARLKQAFPFLDTLKALGIYRPGLFTLMAAARVRDDASPAAGGLVSNQITFQVAERKEDLKQLRPQAQGKSAQREKPQPEKREERPAPGGGKKVPELGDRENLPDVKLTPSLVEPLMNDGPTITKEVNVYDREEGGPAPPLPTPPPPPETPPARTFLRRAEAAIASPDLSPIERQVLRQYFERLRERGGH